MALFDPALIGGRLLGARSLARTKGADTLTSLTVPSVDDWWDLTREFPEFRKVRHGVLKDYGYMAALRFIRQQRPRTILEFGHGMNATLLSACQQHAEVWGIDDHQDLHYFPGKDTWEAQYQKHIVEVCPQARLVRGLLGHPSTRGIPEEHFEMVCSVSVLEEVRLEDVRRITEHAYRLLKPGGFYVNTHDLLLAPTRRRWRTWYERREAYIELQRQAGFQLRTRPRAAIDLHKVLLEDPTIVMIHYQGNQPEERSFRGHWATMFSIARKV